MAGWITHDAPRSHDGWTSGSSPPWASESTDQWKSRGWDSTRSLDWSSRGGDHTNEAAQASWSQPSTAVAFEAEESSLAPAQSLAQSSAPAICSLQGAPVTVAAAVPDSIASVHQDASSEILAGHPQHHPFAMPPIPLGRLDLIERMRLDIELVFRDNTQAEVYQILRGWRTAFSQIQRSLRATPNGQEYTRLMITWLDANLAWLDP